MLIMLVMCVFAVYIYMLLPFEVGIIYVKKCIHLVSGGNHINFPVILLWNATEQVIGNQRYKIYYYS